MVSLFAALPAAVILLEFHPGALAGCGSYGYGCNNQACLVVEIRTAGGSWQKGSAYIYRNPNDPSAPLEINLYVRTTLSTNVDHVEGWSFGLKHTAPTLIGIDGGDFYLDKARAGPGLATVQNGNPPDYPPPDDPAPGLWSCGLTQGVLIDIDESTQYTMGPSSNRVIAEACYRLKFPNNTSLHQVKLEFTDDVGSPPVDNTVSRYAQKIVPCKENLTLYVRHYGSYSTPSYDCSNEDEWPTVTSYPCESEGGGGAQAEQVEVVSMFKRGDTNADGAVNISDVIYSFNWLFSGGTKPPCVEAANANGDNDADSLTDPVYVLRHLFGGGPAPPPPYPECGLAPEPHNHEIHCKSYLPCEQTGPNVSRLPLNQCETTVAVNPNDSNHVVVVSNHDPGPSPAHTPALFRAVSCNGGSTWSVYGIILDDPTDEHLAACDPSLAFDAHGNLHLAYLGQDGFIHVVASTDGGVTFPSGLRRKIEEAPGADYPKIATGPAFGGSNESVWVVFRAEHQQSGRFVAAGATVEDLLDPQGPAPTYSLYDVELGPYHYGDVAIGSHGEVMVAYQELVGPPQMQTTPPAEILLKLRAAAPTGNGDVNFHYPAPMSIARSNVCGSQNGGQVVPAGDSAGASPLLEWDRDQDLVYLAYLQEPKDALPPGPADMDVYLRIGEGPCFAVWSEPRVVFDDPGTQLHHAMALDPTSGNLAVSWYGTRGPGDSTFDYFVAYRDRVTEKFVGVMNLTLDPTIDCRSGQVFVGNDYTAVAFAGGALLPTWGDNSPWECFENERLPVPPGETWDVILPRIQTENCSQAGDEDGDGLSDCADPDCCGHKDHAQHDCSACEDCQDGQDNDGDQKVDCADSDCAGFFPRCGETDCDNDADDDFDGLVDCADPDCEGVTECPEICDNHNDDDADGLVDCVDPDCLPTCPEICTDGIDNDADALVDCLDPQCGNVEACKCGDGQDNDGDQTVDCADPDCAEGCHCADGEDNDADGRTDCDDPECEAACPEDCQDGIDNDADCFVDCDDSECLGVPPCNA